jgi:phospholipase C
VVLIQENHTFDDHFGRYCTSPTGSAPTCTDGPACCEAGPLTDPTGASPIVLDDAAHGVHDPNHYAYCELAEINGGRMDGYVTGAGVGCSDPRNFAYADPTIIQPYFALAATGALADRWFQPVIGASSANDVYLSHARWLFDDNDYRPSSLAAECSFVSASQSFDAPMIGDLLDAAGVSWAVYAGGYASMVSARAKNTCPDAEPGCPAAINISPCTYEPSDIPFLYSSRVDEKKVMRDYTQLASDLAAGKLPQVTFVKAIEFRSEHPGVETTLSDGVNFVVGFAQQMAASSYVSDTLVMVLYDEGGGYFDHVAPPATPDSVDGKLRGTRVPALALGPFAKRNAVVHDVFDHASLVRFIEDNWLGAHGQLGARDTTATAIDSMLLLSGR